MVNWFNFWSQSNAYLSRVSFIPRQLRLIVGSPFMFSEMALNKLEQQVPEAKTKEEAEARIELTTLKYSENCACVTFDHQHQFDLNRELQSILGSAN